MEIRMDMNKNRRLTVLGITIAIVLIAIMSFIVFVLNPSRETSKVKADKDLMWRCILFSIQMYSQEYNGYCPNDMGMLIDGGYMESGSLYVCMGSKTKHPERGDDVRKGNTDFIYLAEGKKYEWDEASNAMTKNTNDSEHAEKIKFAVKENYPVIVTKPGCHKKFLVAYSNGSVLEYEILPKDIIERAKELGKEKEFEVSTIHK